MCYLVTLKLRPLKVVSSQGVCQSGSARNGPVMFIHCPGVFYCSNCLAIVVNILT